MCHGSSEEPEKRAGGSTWSEQKQRTWQVLCVQPGDRGWTQDLPGTLCQEQGTSSAPREKLGEQEGRSSAEERSFLDSPEKPWQEQAGSMPPSQPLLPQTPFYFWGAWRSWLQSGPAPPEKRGAWHSTELSSAAASPALRGHLCLLGSNRSLSGPTRRCSGRAAVGRNGCSGWLLYLFLTFLSPSATPQAVGWVQFKLGQSAACNITPVILSLQLQVRMKQKNKMSEGAQSVQKQSNSSKAREAGEKDGEEGSLS